MIFGEKEAKVFKEATNGHICEKSRKRGYSTTVPTVTSNNITQHHTTSHNITQHHINTKYQTTPHNIKKHHTASQNIRKYHKTS